MKRGSLLAGALALLALAGSAQAQQITRVVTPIAQTLRAGVGDVILSAENREPLPNVFGAPDIFGRTRSTGLITVQYGGARGGTALLSRSSVVVQSDATTMSETGVVVPIDRNTLILPPRRGNITQFQQPTIPIEVDWRRTPRVPMAGRTLIIVDADATSITYRIE